MSKALKKLFRIAAPAAMLIPGVGTAIGAALGAGGAFAPAVGSAVLGAAGGAASGGLKGALLGGTTAGLGGYVGTPGNSLLGSGSLSGAQQSALGGAITGAGQGGVSGGLKGALVGGALGGAGGYYSGGGFDNLLGSTSGDLSASQVDKLLNTTAGNYAGSPVALGSSDNLFSGDNLRTAMTAIGGVNAYSTQNDVGEELKKAQEKAAALMSPYVQSGVNATNTLSDKLQSGELGGTFTAPDLANDPGYQFRLSEGNKALERSLAARGLSESSAALRAAQDYGQNLASQTYNDAFNQWLQKQQNTYGMYSKLSGTGQSAAGDLGNIYGAMGDIGAKSSVATSNIINKTLSDLIPGQQMKVRYDEYGQPVYYVG